MIQMTKEAQKAVRTQKKWEAWRIWIDQRKEAIHERVTVFDVLKMNGVRLRYGNREEQISCPFHGKDTRPSARVHPSDARSPSHVWCFVCNEWWDCIALWKKFRGQDEVKFVTLLREIENAFGIIPPDIPDDLRTYEPEEDPVFKKVVGDLTLCETRLMRAKHAFDMKGFLTIAVVLDRLSAQVENQSADLDKTAATLQTILEKIRLKESECLEG